MKISKTTQRYIMSSIVTFVASFVSVFTLGFTEDITKDALIALCFTALRGGLKAFLEYAIVLLNKKK